MSPGDFLQAFPFAAGLSAQAVERLVQNAVFLRLEKGHLYQPADPERPTAVFVAEGDLRVYQLGAGGVPRTLYWVGGGGVCVASVHWALGQVEQAVWRAAGFQGATLLCIERRPLRQLFHTEPGLQLYLLQAMAEQFAASAQVISQSDLLHIERRVAGELLNRCDDGGGVDSPPNDLASALGVSPLAVQLTLDAMLDRGCIERRAGQVQVVDLPALARIAHEGV